jgi:hypothetical protein
MIAAALVLPISQRSKTTGWCRRQSVIRALTAELNGDSDELLALAGKAPADVGDMLKQSEGARMFFRSAMSKRLSEDDWKKLLREIPPDKK